jgi:hypothetical protein
MQFHYVIGFDTDMQKWFVELDTFGYFPDGNVYEYDSSSPETGYGWFAPCDDTPDLEALDQTLLNTLYSLVDVIPIPQEVS